MNPTDVDDDAPPQGTKRRGSVEKKDAEDDDAPDIEPQPSDKQPQPVERKQSQPYKNTNNAPTKKIIISNNKAIGHRRRNTDGAISFNPKTKLFSNANSNAAVIQLMAKELPLKERLAMQQKAQDLKLERELKHAQIKLRETQDQCNTAVEIIGKLEEEKEDLLSVNDTLRTQLGASTTEIKILEQKNKSLDELYENDLRKYKEEVSSTKKQLSELTDNINQKDMALTHAKEYQKKLQQQLDVDGDGEYNDDGTVNIKSTKEKELLVELEAEKRKVFEKNNKIEELMFQLEQTMRAQQDKESLQNEIDSFAEMAQQDLMYQKEQMEKMQSEIIQLASKNAKLEKERDDLNVLLEERNYENQMLKTGFGLHRNKTANITGTDMNSIANQIGGIDEDYNEEFNSLAFMTDQQPIDGDDINEYESEEYETQRNSFSDSPDKKTVIKKEKQVADVTREYLHLTASVVNMKFPRVQHIPSEELINKVKNYNFWEYHDMMVRIMKTEEQKLLAKEKAKQEEKKQQQTNATGKKEQSGGMLGRFRNFFGGGNDKNSSKSGTRERGSSSSVDRTTQKMKGQSNTRIRNKSAHAKPTTTEKKAPTAAFAKQKFKSVTDKAKVVKDSAVKKVTNKPSDEESAKMADMSFKSVPALDSYNVQKATKPKQGL